MGTDCACAKGERIGNRAVSFALLDEDGDFTFARGEAIHTLLARA